MSTLTKSLLICLCCIIFSAQCEEVREVAPPWKSEFEIGFQRLTGNADSMSVNTRLATAYTRNEYYHSSEMQFLLVEKDGEQDKHRSNFESQANYKYSDHYYALANVNYLSDKYGAYFKDFSVSLGLGYFAIWQENLTWLLEFGPGYRYQRPNLEAIDDDDLILPHDVREPILRGQTALNWRISETALIESRMTVITGDSNRSVESRVALETNVMGDLALKISSTWRYINKIPPDLKKLDTIFNVNLVYFF